MRKYKEKSETKELNNILRAYFFVLIILICMFSIFAGITEAKNNIRKISFGENIEIIKMEDVLYIKL